jgi:hypothetical protein
MRGSIRDITKLWKCDPFSSNLWYTAISQNSRYGCQLYLCSLKTILHREGVVIIVKDEQKGSSRMWGSIREIRDFREI